MFLDNFSLIIPNYSFHRISLIVLIIPFYFSNYSYSHWLIQWFPIIPDHVILFIHWQIIVIRINYSDYFNFWIIFNYSQLFQLFWVFFLFQIASIMHRKWPVH